VKNAPAFPTSGNAPYLGLDVRTYIAAEVLARLSVVRRWLWWPWRRRVLARRACQIADALMREME